MALCIEIKNLLLFWMENQNTLTFTPHTRWLGDTINKMIGTKKRYIKMLKYREEKLQEINIVYQILGIRCTLWNMFPFWMRSYILWTLLSMQSKIKKKKQKANHPQTPFSTTSPHSRFTVRPRRVFYCNLLRICWNIWAGW